MNQTLRSCPGCSGVLEPLATPSLALCDGCGGLVSLVPVPREVALDFVKLDALVAGQATTYFDLDILDAGEPRGWYRVHGWMDDDGNVVQVG